MTELNDKAIEAAANAIYKIEIASSYPNHGPSGWDGLRDNLVSHYKLCALNVITAYQTACWSDDMEAAKDAGVILALSADNEIEQLQHDELYDNWNRTGGRCADISDYTHWQPLPKGPEVKS